MSRTKERFGRIRGKPRRPQYEFETEEDAPSADLSYRKDVLKNDTSFQQDYNSKLKREHAGDFREEVSQAKPMQAVPEETNDQIYSFAFLPQFHNEHLFRAQLDKLQANNDTIMNTPQVDEEAQPHPATKSTKIPHPTDFPREEQFNQEDHETRVPRDLPHNRAQRINAIRHRTYDKTRGGKSKEEMMDYIQKMEYQRALDLQILEKQLKQAADQKIRQLEERIEELQESKAHMQRELEKKSASPQTNFGRSKYNNIFNESSAFKSGIDKANLKKYHYSGKKPAPPQEISNAVASSKKSILPTHENSPSRDNLNNSAEYASANIFHYLQLQQEFSKIRGELKENTRRLQKQISDMHVILIISFFHLTGNFAQFKSQFSTERLSYEKLSNSPPQLDKKTPDYQISIRREIIKENPAIITTPFRTMRPGEVIASVNGSKMSLLNQPSLEPALRTDRSRDNSENRIERVALNNLLELIKSLEKGLTAEDTNYKKELQDLKIEIHDLLDGMFDKDRYDDIKENLIEVSEQIQNNKRASIIKLKPRLQKATRGIRRRCPEIEIEDDQRRRLAQQPPEMKSE